MVFLGGNEFLKCHFSNARSLIENSKFISSFSGLSRGQKERADHVRQIASMRVLGKRTELATDSLRVHILEELHHITPFVYITVTVQLTRIALTISSCADDSLMIEQTMRNGVSNDELGGITHSNLQSSISFLSFAVLVDVLLGQNAYLLQSSQLSANDLVEVLDLWLQVFADLFEAFQSAVIAEIRNGAIPIDLCFGLSHSVDPKPPAVVILVKDPDPARNDLKYLHFLDLVAFLLALGERLIRGELVDVLLDFLAFLRQQILEYVIDPVIVKIDIVLFGVVKQANQPRHVIVSDLLVFYLLGQAGHSQRMLYFQLKIALGSLVTVNFLVQLARLDDSAVVAQVEAILLLQLVQGGNVNQTH